MGALPKNKVTRAERGKRRRGNTPTLTKTHTKNQTPLHKRGFMAKMMKKLELWTKPLK